jgi:hypothetical protein
MGRKNKKKGEFSVVIKASGINVSIGHQPHKTGTGVHDNRPRKERTRSSRNIRAIRDFD